jgi:hypothetical protein
MTEQKTRKLVCIITGKALVATRQYYERKLKKIGDEEEMHRTYVCKEAKNLLIKGYTVNKIRDMLQVDTSQLQEVPEDVVVDILNSSKPRYKSININNMPISSILNPKTDPRVKKFLQHIIHNDNQ